MALSWGAFHSEHKSARQSLCVNKREPYALPRPGTRMRCGRSVGRSLPQVRLAFLIPSNSASFWVKVIALISHTLFRKGSNWMAWVLLMSAAQSSVVIVYSACISVQKLCPLLVSVFHELRSKQRFFPPLQHKLAGLCNVYAVCFLWGRELNL